MYIIVAGDVVFYNWSCLLVCVTVFRDVMVGCWLVEDGRSFSCILKALR